MKKAAIAVLLVLLTGLACGPSSRITSSWTASGISNNGYRKIIVLALLREPDRGLREKMEQHLVGDLRNIGYDAICSCDEYNPKAFENMNEEQSIAKLRGSGVDAVVTIVLLDKTKEKMYVPGRVIYSPYYQYHNHFWSYSRSMYNRINVQGYYEENTRYFWESNFYDLSQNNLLYSAQSQSFDPPNAETMGHEYGMMITRDMVKKGLLKETAAR